MNILEIFKKTKKYQDILDTISLVKEKQNIYIGNCASNVAKMITASFFKDQTIVYVCSNIFEASKTFEMFVDLVGTDSVSFFPVEEFISMDIVASSSAFRLARTLTLHNIIENVPQIIVTNVEGITKNVMSKRAIKESVLQFRQGQILEIDQLAEMLVIRGYKKTSITTDTGTFSVRGSVIDVFPINSDNPVRFSFFDNELETIKKIDIETQMSHAIMQDVTIFPLYDIYYNQNSIDDIVSKIKSQQKITDKLERTINNLYNYQNIEQLYIYLPYIDNEYQSFLNLIEKPFCVFEDFNELLDHEAKTHQEMLEYVNQQNYKLAKGFLKNLFDVLEYSHKNIFCNHFVSSLNNVKLDKYFDIKTHSVFEYNNNLKAMFDDIEASIDKTYLITNTDEQKLGYIEEFLENRNLNYRVIENIDELKSKRINVCVCENAYGFGDYDKLLEVLTPNEYAPGKISKNAKYQRFYNQSTKIYTKDELSPGDYVVHQDYGIGKYLGIKTIELRGKKNDYLGVQYAEDSKLYIPVENIHLLEKYIGSRDQMPRLNNLNSKEFQKKKAKIKEKVLSVARDLLKVQAERQSQQGYIYKTDSEFQKEFEQDFAFTETNDQLKAIIDVKNDMEGTRPLDRLICGDVGFGKTEVAMRAAFKAVDNGKQVAYLAPTTVLTRQHYYTFKDRFEKFGVRVELVNRFVSPQQQKNIARDLQNGLVDIIIGTHRLLSPDFKYKDLGLLIVDEEQRFGVTHKEKIKQLKSLVDVLTLTATPIPRTLQMSLSGLVDLSLIETPPVNRLPIQTYVLESNPSVIREAINRELGRGGQVFYLLNRIDQLEKQQEKIHGLVPKARIGLIHGRLSKDVIEEELTMFLDRKYDVLLCTTIIETGIDIPNANTLIIEKADILGLSQLYQIRGRVGRSERIAYAYLMYDENTILTEEAEKRLETIKEFTALGSGYKIAMRDLAIRGAGDILGQEQSGFIDAIGMDLYMKLLSEAIAEIKGDKLPEGVKRQFNIDISRHISPQYVSDDEIRIEIHKSISTITSRKQIDDLILEYTDRYGKLPNDVLIYMEEKYLETLLKEKQIENFKEGETIVLNFDEEASSKINAAQLMDLSLKFAPKFKFEFVREKIYIKIKSNEYENSYIYTLNNFLEKVKII